MQNPTSTSVKVESTSGLPNSVAAFFEGVSPASATPLYVAAALAVLHSLVTTQAAPTNVSQRRVAKDEVALVRVFDRFERWQTPRAALQVLNFGAMLWALVVYVSAC
jgi:hypothetical protein